MTDLQRNVESVIALNGRMHADLVEFLKEHGGLIRTDNHDDRDTIYGIVMDDAMEENVEHPILAVALMGDDVCVLFDKTNGHTTLEEMTDEEILEDDDWYSVLGGYVLPASTLYCLCEGIEQYV